MGSYISQEYPKPEHIEYIDVREELENERNEIKGDEILKTHEMPPEIEAKRKKRKKKKNRNKIKNGL